MTAWGTDTVVADRYEGATLWQRLRYYPAGNVVIVFVAFAIAATVVGEIFPMTSGSPPRPTSASFCVRSPPSGYWRSEWES